MHLSKRIIGFTVFSLFVFQFCESSNSSSSSKDWPTHPEPPRLTLISNLNDWQTGKSDDPYLGNRGYISPTINDTLALQCTASYPVYFEFVPSSTNIYTFFNYLNSTQYNETLAIRYTTNATAFNKKLVGRSGNYTCRSGLDKNVASSMYIHIRDAALFGVDPEYSSYSRLVENKYWTIPCPAHVAHFDEVSLYRSNSTEDLNITVVNFESWTSDQLNESNGSSKIVTVGSNTMIELNYTKYDPRHGFLLSKSEYSRPEGRFICFMRLRNITEDAHVFLKNFTVIPQEQQVTYRNNNKFQVTCEADEEIRIDYSRSPLFKEISSFRSNSPSFNYSLVYVFELETNTSKILKALNFSEDDIEKIYTNVTEGIIECVAVNSSKVLHSWINDVEGLCRCSSYTSNAQVSAIIGETDFGYSIEQPNFSCDAAIGFSSSSSIFFTTAETKSKSSVLEKYYDLQPPTEQTKYSLSPDYYSYYRRRDIMSYIYTSSIVSCALGGYKTLFDAVATPSGYDFNPVRTNASQHLKVVQREDEKLNYFVGDDIEISCVASRYLFYNGSIQWTFNYKNGTTHSLEQTEGALKVSKDINSYSNSFINEWGYVETISMEIPKKLESVSCSATVWNSTEIAVANFTILYTDLEDSPKYYSLDEIQSQWCNQPSSQPVIIMERILRSSEIRFSVRGRLKWNVVTNLNVTMPEGYESVNLHCVAHYPMEWTFQGDDMSEKAVRIYDRVETENTTKSVSPSCFRNIITVPAGLDSSTGEYKCGRKYNTVSSSVYLYTTGRWSTNRLLNPGGHVYVAIEQQKQITILPCRVTHPDVLVELYYHETHKSLRKLLEPEFITYDPRKGFLMKTSELNISDIYICSLVNSTAPQNSITFSFISSSENTEKAYSVLNGTVHRMEHTIIKRINSSTNKMEIVQITILVILIAGLTALTWFMSTMRKHLRNGEKAATLKSYRYSQLNSSLCDGDDAFVIKVLS